MSQENVEVVRLAVDAMAQRGLDAFAEDARARVARSLASSCQLPKSLPTHPDQMATRGQNPS
jgi:hypothetical protein